jgi:hypothetical protein
MFCCPVCFFAQGQDTLVEIPAFDYTDTVNMDNIDTAYLYTDSMVLAQPEKSVKKKQGLEAPVEYTAQDSIIYDLDSQYVYLYGSAVVIYQDITLEASYIRFDMGTKEVMATGMPDSAGTIAGNPLFKQGQDEYNAKVLSYNFGTRQAYIESIITEEEGGFLHSEQSKRQSNEQIHAWNNKYTTCDLEHPHFYIALKKAIVIPDKKIVSGPAHFVIADVPLYFPFLPFGFFPTPKKRSAGILVPTFGDEGTSPNSRGFYLRDLGYYWPINDYVDLTLMSDIYTKGAWGINAGMDYVKRYRFNGNFSFDYQKNVSGDKGFGEGINAYQVTKYYKVLWSHSQDQKANPTQTFRASVNWSSTGYEKEYGRSLTDIYQNSKSSSISYGKTWDHTFLGTSFRFTTSLNHSQNNTSNQQTLNFPNFSANSGNLYFFPKKEVDTKKRFYHDIYTKYTAQLDNKYTNTEDVFFDEFNLENSQSRFHHRLPLTLPVKFIKFLPFNISMSYDGWLFKEQYKYEWDTTLGDFRKDTVYGFNYVQRFNPIPSFNNITLNRNLYVTMQSTKADSRIRALRYVMLPKASLSFTPAMKGKTPGYYRYAYGPTDTLFYSIYEGAPFGSPPGVSKKSNWTGRVALNLDNSLEMKVRSRNDTANNETKIKLLEQLSFRSSYNIFADSMNWDVINFNTGASFFKRVATVRVNGSLDPYALNAQGNRVNRFEINENGRLARLTNVSMNMDINLGGSQANRKKEKDENDAEEAVSDYDYFDVPWSLRGSYSWNYRRTTEVPSITQVLTVNGSITFTPNWSFSYTTGYDLDRKQFSPTQFNIHRNLHCWEFSLTVIPFGSNRFFEFRINAIASMLKDLKYEFDRNWRENY